MPGAFDASPRFDHDPLSTADEVQHSGEEVLRWLETVATSTDPRPVDLELVKEIHFRWFESTFRTDAGRLRAEMVLNRKGTAVEVDAILPAVVGACENWNWRRKSQRPADDLELIEFNVTEANTLAVRIYEVHPFIDGKHEGNLASTQLRPHARRPETPRRSFRPRSIRNAWWSAAATDHTELDEIVLAELAAQQP